MANIHTIAVDGERTGFTPEEVMRFQIGKRLVWYEGTIWRILTKARQSDGNILLTLQTAEPRPGGIRHNISYQSISRIPKND